MFNKYNITEYNKDCAKGLIKLYSIITKYKKREKKLVEVIDMLVELSKKHAQNDELVNAINKMHNDVHGLINYQIDDSEKILDKVLFGV